MSSLEIWGLAYCIAWTVGAHIWVGYRLHDRRQHYRRSKRARKAAATRKRNGTQPGRKKTDPAVGTGRSPWAGPEPVQPPKPTVEEARTVLAESAWITLTGSGDEEEPDFNETDPKTWKPMVRRFDGGASEYARRNDSPGSVRE